MRIGTIAALVLSCSSVASAQQVISAQAGVVHYLEGQVLVDGKVVDQKLGTFNNLKEKSELQTQMGRAEILLTPGVFLRVGENSSVKMITNRLIDTRVEFVKGEAIVESDDPMKNNAVTLVYNDFQVHLRKACVLGFESNPAQLKVYHGEAEVETGGSTVTVKAGKLMPFTAAMVTEKFDPKEGSSLSRWSMRRSEYVSAANLSAAKSLHDSGSAWNSSGWYYNPYYSMFTYIPLSGTYFNPYGFGFFSPYTIGGLYNYYPYYASRYGNYGGGGTVANTGLHTGDQSNRFGRSANTEFGANNNSFGRSSSGFGGASAPSGGGSLSGGAIGGGSGGAMSSAPAASGGGGHAGHR